MACATLHPVAAASLGPRPGSIKNLVTFGDSYTDIISTGDHGTAWPVYAAQVYGHFNLFPFARSGATCSNNITFRPFPSLFESQLPLYFEEKNNGSIRLDPAETVYTLWIGTNDVGANSLIVGQGTPGVSLVNVTECAVNWVKVLYESGARNFLFQNMLPLYETPLYSADSWPNQYWTAQRNTTEWSVFMREMVNTGNALSKALLQLLVPTLKGAHVGYFDSFGLFSDMLANPKNYLNGTAPLNVTGAVHACVFDLNESTSGTSDCTIATGSAVDSFLWYDELHPSEQADRQVAKFVAGAISRQSDDWVTWLS
ncbi:GDSL lipase/esterase [Irpex rosettiformis]|uniref:GDSL lipase/esterase n=1 Tax=Irpex rosettiformis TaxID=378272 RepID=A0ACB8UFX7_9APHY|nr:GDSL lipase/esterase [Irpex rosettiformis]